jgi:(p)ppGpp synthase/HD superfamily hydrolase
MFTLDDAIALARQAHEGQVDKSGAPYIGHPLRVMARVSGDHQRMVAVLHDVVEDTWVTAEHLAEAGCPAEVIDAVIAISHLPGEPQSRLPGPRRRQPPRPDRQARRHRRQLVARPHGPPR